MRKLDSTITPQRILIESSLTILDTILSFVTAYLQSQDKANKLEKKLLTFAIRVNILVDLKKASWKDLLTLKQPLHKLCDKVIDAFEIPFSFNARELIDIIEEIQKALLKHLKALPEKSLKKMNDLFATFTNEEMLEDFFKKKKWKETGEVANLLRRMWEDGYV